MAEFSIPELRTSQLTLMLDWNLCILCQEESSQPLSFPTPEKYSKVLSVVNERASICDTVFILINKRLQNSNAEDLKRNKAQWHRSCYSKAAHKAHIKRAHERYKKSLKTSGYVTKKVGRPSGSVINEPSSSNGSPTHFTRSATQPLNADLCFFCQIPTDVKVVFS